MTQKILKLFYFLRRGAATALFFALPFWLAAFAFSVYAAPSTRAPVNQTNFFVNELPDDVNNNCSLDVFIPLKTQAERTAFVNNKPGCLNFGWSQQFTLFDSGSNEMQNFLFNIPYLNNISNFVFNISNQLSNSMTPESSGFNNIFYNALQNESMYLGVRSSYPLEFVCTQFGYGCSAGYYQVTINGQVYIAEFVCTQVGYGCSAGYYQVTINGQVYIAEFVCTQFGYGCSAGYYFINIPFAGSVTVYGNRSIIISDIVGPINGYNGCCTGAFRCPSGTFLYGLWNNRNMQIRSDWPHNILGNMYCAQSFGATTDNISSVIAMFGGGGGVCAQDEYVKGFDSFLVSSANLYHSQLSYMYCAKLASPSLQAVPDEVNLYAYGTGAISARIAGDHFRAIVGLTGGWDYGPGDSAGPRFYANSFYTRSIPVVY